jgi:mannose-6-phosphate isomerase-like protein (cupin superfamily)
MSVINIKQKLSLFDEYWSPKIVGELNDDKVQLAKLKGKFTWHTHAIEDELFIVLKGKLLVHFRDKTEEVNEGEMIIVLHGIEHMTEALDETHIIYIAPKEEVNTGDAKDMNLTAKEESI